MRVNCVHMMQLQFMVTQNLSYSGNYTDLANPHAQGNKYTPLTSEEVRQDKYAQVC